LAAERDVESRVPDDSQVPVHEDGRAIGSKADVVAPDVQVEELIAL
jgi:hypothetical protein